VRIRLRKIVEANFMANSNLTGLGYSADVRMQLNVNGFILPIGQLGPGFIMLDNPPDHPPSDAEIVMWIDNDERRWKVYLPDGISAAKTRTRTTSCV
jgi:hypothetical protein